MKRTNDPEKSGTPTKWAQLKKWYMEHIHYRVTEWWMWNKYKIFSTFVNVLIFLCIIALPAGCVTAIVIGSKNAERQRIEAQKDPNYLGVLDSNSGIQFEKVTLKSHDFWKYYSDGYHYIHSPECRICYKEVNPDTILVISNE